MRHAARNARRLVSLDQRHHLALNLLSAAPRPLGNDLHVLVGYERIGLDGQRNDKKYPRQ